MTGRRRPQRPASEESPRRPGEISFATRRRIFLVAGAGLAALLVWGMSGLPDFGDYAGVYGETLNRVAVGQRHATDLITAVNFDYRGFDTLGEEFILFAAVLGLALLLREQRTEEIGPPDDDAEDRRVPHTSETVRLATFAIIGPTVVLSIYVIAHGQLTPGGGFQGGVIAATALLLVYLGGEYVTLSRVRPLALIELTKATGAGAFVLIGLGGLIAAGAFLENFLPLGTTGTLLSGGTIPLLSVAVGLEVTGGFVLLISEFLEQALVVRSRRAAPAGGPGRRRPRGRQRRGGRRRGR